MLRKQTKNHATLKYWEENIYYVQQTNVDM